jgi:hypothetical protein
MTVCTIKESIFFQQYQAFFEQGRLIWIVEIVVTFPSVMGSPEVMTVTASNGDISAGPSHSDT